MEVRPSAPLPIRRILELARSDRRSAEQELARLALADQAALVCEAPLARRSGLLALMPDPADVIPLLPEAELCFTVNASGLESASWLVEHATREQIVACIDLDGWRGLHHDPARLWHWLATFVEAGEEALSRATQALDPELLVLGLRERAEISLKPNDDEDWQPPEGGQTRDGQFYFVARHDGDDLADLVRLLDVAFRKDYWLYFRILQGCIWELPSELEEWALRWRTGRLEDLGFPSWDQSMRIYGYLRPEECARIPDDERPLDVRGWPLPVWLTDLPATRDGVHAIFRAAAELSEEERRGFFYAFVAIANKVAVADGMLLGDAETLPAAVEKAAGVTSGGLEHVARENGLTAPDVLRRVSLERLFRVGASLESRSGSSRQRPQAPELSDPSH